MSGPDTNPPVSYDHEHNLLSNVRQLIFAGRRSGEGYFSPDGKMMIFQSEREQDNPFFQIYLLDLETGDTKRVSPGGGKTTCGWIHLSGKKVLFASTHEDLRAEQKQQEEFQRRASDKQRRYTWDYDEHYDIYASQPATGELINLTRAQGYDAEGSYSPDGKFIVFASNRHAYTNELSQDDAEKFTLDKSYLIDIHLMNADGSGLRRLTTAKGYDGGPFFSPGGKRICWRRFDEKGTRAEVFTMNIDGSDQRQITKLGAMSWAPFYHPSGDYLIFTTNVHGFSNFELYIVDREGRHEPVRVTFTDGFDGLPVFTPDGQQLCWTSKRTLNGTSQLFMADWNDTKARSRLGLAAMAEVVEIKSLDDIGSAAITQNDLERHVYRLASEQMEGRRTGTRGEMLATQYVAGLFHLYGLQPAGVGDSFFQEFQFTAGVSLGPQNNLRWYDEKGRMMTYRPDHDWRPLAFSDTGKFDPAPLVFAGYGIHAPATGENDPSGTYDSYAHLDVKDKWVLILRYLPEDIPAERRQALSRFASLRYKAMVARDKGARGLIVVSGPNSPVKKQLVRLSFDASLAGTSTPVISVTDELAQNWLEAMGKDLKQLQAALDGGEMAMGFDLGESRLEATIDIEQEKRTGRNVLARLSADVQDNANTILIGAHIDHLGRGIGSSSLATNDDKTAIHYGADDNASGVATVLEMAQHLADKVMQGTLKLKHDIVFAAWSGEELGLLGSGHFARVFFGTEDETSTLYPAIAAYVNLDMVGRYEKGLTLHGVGSSSVWPKLIERANVPIGLKIIPQNDSYVPSDATTFYVNGVPILSAFTGAHSDYHTPKDTPDKINYSSTQQVARFLTSIVRALAAAESLPDYIATERPKPAQSRGGLRAYLGTVPDYSQTDIKGVKLSAVGRHGPAEKAGLTGGDIVVELAGRKLENIYDYTYAIDALKIGQPVAIVVLRDGQRLKLEITPESRE